jgi:PEP-CTERM motif-containing protein
MRIKSLLVSTLITAGAISAPTSSLAAFVDWTAIDATANTASGTLNSATVTLSTTANPASLFDPNGGVAGGNDSGTSTAFANPVFFTPSIALTDTVDLNSSSSFLFTFSEAISNLTLHLAQLASTTVTFNAPFTLVSSDGDFLTTSNSIQGTDTSPDDANGSLLFSGPLSSLSWTASTPNFGDGVSIQFSVDAPAAIPEPGSLGLLGLALAAAVGIRRRSRSL